MKVFTAATSLMAILATKSVSGFTVAGGKRAFTRTALASQTIPVIGEEDIMSQKKHGTSEAPVQKNLRWGCDWETADRICNFNRYVLNGALVVDDTTVASQMNGGGNFFWSVSLQG